MTPKANGGQRLLGIPTVRDRVVRTAAKLVVEPIFEADFLPVSYGFRPARSVHDALDAVKEGLRDGLNAVYDADLKGDFDTIPHHQLMACVEWRIADGAVLKLIRQWLWAPVVEEPMARHQPPRKVKRRVGPPARGCHQPVVGEPLPPLAEPALPHPRRVGPASRGQAGKEDALATGSQRSWKTGWT